MRKTLLLALLLAGCAESKPDLSAGKVLYAQHCAACHGAKLEGQPNWRSKLPNGRMPAPPHDDSGHTWHHPDEVLIGITKHGLVPPYAPPGYESDMPAFAGTLSRRGDSRSAGLHRLALVGRSTQAARRNDPAPA